MKSVDGLSDEHVTEFSPRKSNQWWRLLISIYLHQGILDCLLITFVQIWVSWRQEYSQGWLRMALFHHTSGVGGHLVCNTTESCRLRKCLLLISFSICFADWLIVYRAGGSPGRCRSLCGRNNWPDTCRTRDFLVLFQSTKKKARCVNILFVIIICYWNATQREQFVTVSWFTVWPPFRTYSLGSGGL